jgi:hypothetical protein
MDEFCGRSGISKLRMTMVEHAQGGVPDRRILTAYLETCQPDEATRHRVRELWNLATATETAAEPGASGLEAVVESVEQAGQHSAATNTHLARIPDADDAIASLLTAASTDVHYSLAKPAWRRSTAVSRADTSLWPEPDTIASSAQFTEALLAIKMSTGLSYKALAVASQRHSYPLARSTLHALCTRQKLPASPQPLDCFIEICGGSKTDIQRWRMAWQRLSQGSNSTEHPDSDESGLNTTTLAEDEELEPSTPRVPLRGIRGGVLARTYTVTGYQLLIATVVVLAMLGLTVVLVWLGS